MWISTFLNREDTKAQRNTRIICPSCSFVSMRLFGFFLLLFDQLGRALVSVHTRLQHIGSFCKGTYGEVRLTFTLSCLLQGKGLLGASLHVHYFNCHYSCKLIVHREQE